ncbi:hypothetical protein NUU61_007854 [Penicillium alfredii]|uniref:Zn(2)-C6 fungal-type domain-containing protein n=1 Tax=Penicillium alfredii TaxID=1506179 RepID=A0A9W9ERB1_9EURO|nr:uncharacterized protein NUU61_007854 [Penicillium alfredii]KAJ5086547.1 hypothetical protein NUU61_007854 [Penicillium alfredii]
MSAISRKRRARTGCRTCRIKCDEIRPRCHRCESTGRTCDGYELAATAVRDAAIKNKGRRKLQPQTLRRNNDKPLIITTQPRSTPSLSTAEGESFAFFKLHTAREIAGGFDSTLWNQIILPLSNNELSIFHAAVAVGAMHRLSRGQCPSLTMTGFFEPKSPFAIRQYVKSVNQLRSRLNGPSDAVCGEVALVACLLFICLEMLQGNRPGALAHLRTGLRILSTMQIPDIQFNTQEGKIGLKISLDCGPLGMRLLASTFARLDYQSTMFGEQAPALALDLVSNTDGPAFGIPCFFTSVAEARLSLDVLANAVHRFRGELLALAGREIDHENTEMDWIFRYCLQSSRAKTVDLSSHPILEQQKAELSFKLARWLSAFQSLATNPLYSYARPTLLLETQHFYIDFLLSTSRDTREEKCDHFDNTFQRIVSLVERLTGNATFSSNVQTPINLPTLTFTLEPGVIPVLYLVAMKCRSTIPRRRAISLLDATRCQEGMWEGSLIARFVEQVADMEESAAGITPRSINVVAGDIPESARFNDVVLAGLEDLGYGRLVCARYLHASTSEIEILEEIFRL